MSGYNRRKWYKIILSDVIQQKLANLPEHGMDSQVCDLTLRNGTIVKQTVVKGCRLFCTGKKLTTYDVVDAKLSF